MLPPEFLTRMEALLGAEYADFLAAYDRPLQKGLRLSGRKRLDGQLECLREPIPWARDGYAYDPESRPGKHPYHEAGLYYLQEPSAMAPAAALGVRPGLRVLDLCAAPGGKSTQIADLLGGQGILVANEIHPARARILLENVERMGVPNAVVCNETPARIAAHFGPWFDAVLVDAPCSGEGMFRRDPEAVAQWSAEAPARCH